MNPNRQRCISVITGYLTEIDIADESEGEQGYGRPGMGLYRSRRQKLTGG